MRSGEDSGVERFYLQAGVTPGELTMQPVGGALAYQYSLADGHFAAVGTVGTLKNATVTTVQRDALTNPQGCIVYNTTNSQFEGHNGAIWVPFGATASLQSAYDVGASIAVNNTQGPVAVSEDGGDPLAAGLPLIDVDATGVDDGIRIGGATDADIRLTGVQASIRGDDVTAGNGSDLDVVAGSVTAGAGTPGTLNLEGGSAVSTAGGPLTGFGGAGGTNQAGGLVNFAGGGGDGIGAGGLGELAGGPGGATGNGGDALVVGGAGGLTSGDGGDVDVTGGSAVTGAGGTVRAIAGVPATSGDAGDIELLGQDGVGVGSGSSLVLQIGVGVGGGGDGVASFQLNGGSPDHVYSAADRHLGASGTVGTLKNAEVTTAQRNAMTNPTGCVVLNSDDTEFQGHDGSAWVSFGGPNILETREVRKTEDASTSSSSYGNVGATALSDSITMAASEFLLIDFTASGYLDGILTSGNVFFRVSINGTVWRSCGIGAGTGDAWNTAITGRVPVGSFGLVAGANTILVEWRRGGSGTVHIDAAGPTDGSHGALRLQRSLV